MRRKTPNNVMRRGALRSVSIPITLVAQLIFLCENHAQAHGIGLYRKRLSLWFKPNATMNAI